jgi:catechol 2,3-dioxygenase-like lactoylglutathione lyase family enzyme
MENIMEAKKSNGVHVSLKTKNLGTSIRFYQDFLGIEPAKVKPSYAKFVTQDPELHLALNEVPAVNAGAGTLSHLGFRIEKVGAVADYRDRLVKSGVNIALDEKAATCCYAKQTKFWVADPDGNRWEVYTVHEDVEEENVPTKAPQAAACCV